MRAIRAGRWRSFGMTLALLALLQSAVVLFHVPMRGPNISFGATISLSSHHPGDAQPDHAPNRQQGDEADDSGHNRPACPVCFVLQKTGTLLLPAEFGVGLPPRLEAPRSIAPAQAPASNADVSIPQSRAPPEMA